MLSFDQIVMFCLEAIIVILLLLTLLNLRSRLGLAPLFVALGVFQPIQVLLASSLYAEILPGMFVSPGSVIMFTASLSAVLIVYILEDADETGKVIYGVLIANLAMTLLLYVFGIHLKMSSTFNVLGLPVEIFHQSARVMLSGTIVLFADVLLIIFVYEMVCKWVKGQYLISIYLTLSIVLIFDSLVFYTGAFYGQDNYSSILISGVIGKLFMAAFFAVGATLYLKFIEQRDHKSIPFHDIFYALTYRQKYETEKIHRSRATEQVKQSEERFRLLVENAPDAIFVRDKSCFTYLNEAAIRLFGADSAQDLIGTPIIERYHPEIREDIRERMQILNEQHLAVPLRQSVCLQMDGTEVDVESVAVPMNFEGKDGSLIFMRNITDRVEEQNQQLLLEEQLHQSQKIESLGRLAGGVAHDYNNMLSVILGYSELAQMKVNPSDPIQNYLEQIHNAAIRSRDITRQLLAFARKQIINPKVMDLNDSVENMLKMLRNLLGENINLAWHPKKDIWPVKMDPSQLDQILANLCINARDSIADVGKMTIETNIVTFNEDYCKDHLGFIPGDFVMFAVSDDGCGMDSEILANIFEPFFTTKEVGEGSGLGLATVYGVVKQANGFINVYSEPGQGTTFKIYLPRCEELETVIRETVTAEVLKGQGETVLLVEDEAAIITLATAMLEDLGYHVLAANSPVEALSLVEAHQGEIHLLLTDVVMPGMNGRDLAKQIQKTCPEMKILFMSGYTANVIAHHGVLDEGINFIQKPFSRSDLSIRLREALDSKP